MDIIKKGPADYEKILGSGVQFTDPDFKANQDSIYWSDYPRPSSASLAPKTPYLQWYRPNQKYVSYPLFNQWVGEYDITQGSVGDCFWLSPAQSMAQDPTRIKGLFINQDYPKEGLLALKFFVKGKPEIITIDDLLPFYNGSPFFTKRADDGDFWMPFIEKAFAKLNGNYEAIGGGWQSESFRILNGAPSKFFMNANVDRYSAWSIISDALSKGNLVGVDTSSNYNSYYGLATGHAHTVIGQYLLKDIFGNVQYKLYRIRNPWGSDSYTGPWSDSDSRWTTYYKSQLPYANDNDGYFYISDDDFVKAFFYFTVNYFKKGWKTSFYERLDDDGSQQSYTFTTTVAQEIYIGADFYDARMYATGCRNGQTTNGLLQLLKGTTVLDQVTFSDQLGYGFLYQPSLAAGNYTIRFKPTWSAYDEKDYTVSVYSANQVMIFDAQGKTSNTTYNLMTTLSQVMSNLTPYPYENGGWYFVRKGYVGSTNNDTYFFQFGGQTNLYNLNATVSFTSYSSTIYTPNSGTVQKVKNSDGTITYTHLCQVLPKQAINDCEYILDVNNGVKWAWNLVSWNYA
ncbi:calpain family cysteine protease containing protein [Stylonychia lemnae]|uniref:Calpain family cysteine protease containing protein n=1 Tax=Stylonychia lemnae TaxID=5949 RepID=A0A078A847_STYLE|nr:calpain family cysteine protease containing protein [Stylonychia lemnae]|eukprot:CDW77757.1 calpain family cysteine protease containing protein [Stylonychia lemnae]